MKKTLIFAISLFVAFAFTACDPVEKTKEELLTQKKGWVLTAATSDPAYHLQNGNVITDLFNHGYFEDQEKNDIYFYETGGALKIDPKNNSYWDSDKIFTVGNWVLNYPNLTTKVPSFYDKDPVTDAWIMDKVKILELTENKLVYEYGWDVAKKSPDYTFTLTFEIAK